MKTKFLGLAAIPLLALLVTSCAKETVETNFDGGKVAYGVATGKHTLGTRATELNMGNITGQTLTVRPYYNNGVDANTVFNGGYTLTHDGTKWGYGAEEFHPAQGLTHYAVHPATGITLGSVDAAAGTATFAYTVPVPQVDLIASKVTKTTNVSQAAATANLFYQHLLSQVNFAVKGLENLKITVSNVKVNSVENAGTFTMGTAGTTLALDGDNDGNYTYSAAGVTTDGTAAQAANPLTLNISNNALMLMPQAFTAAATDGSFTFDFTMKNMAGVVIDSGSVTVPFGHADLSANAWVAGYRYLYVIYFEAPFVIRYTVEEVEDWEDANIPVDVDNRGDGESTETDDIIPDNEFPED